jgi:cytochrome c
MMILRLVMGMVVLTMLSSTTKMASGDETPSMPEERVSGSRIYEQRACGACHARSMDQTVYGLGPSLTQIAEAYEGREDQLVRFLQGAHEPILDAAREPRFPVMHGQIVKLKDLSEAELRELVNHILEALEKP